MDLYRLAGKSVSEFNPLDLDTVFREEVALVEWPVRLPTHLRPPHRLDVHIGIQPDDERVVTMTPTTTESVWSNRLKIIRDEGYVDDLLLPQDERSTN